MQYFRVQFRVQLSQQLVSVSYHLFRAYLHNLEYPGLDLGGQGWCWVIGLIKAHCQLYGFIVSVLNPTSEAKGGGFHDKNDKNRPWGPKN